MVCIKQDNCVMQDPGAGRQSFAHKARHAQFLCSSKEMAVGSNFELNRKHCAIAQLMGMFTASVLRPLDV